MMTKQKVLAVGVCVFALAVAAAGSDKEYQDGSLSDVVAAGKGWENNITGNGHHRVYYYDFTIHLGETTYVGRYTTRSNNLLKKQVVPTSGPVQVRFEKKNALVAHETDMFLKFPDNKKELKTRTDLGWGRGGKGKESALTQ